MASVSVQIVTYNSERDIERCLQAVREQTHPVERIVVLDNASRDGTLALLRAHQPDARLRVVESPVNTGFAGGHNQALRLANSDYVLVLNPDVTLEPDYVAELVRHMESHPDVGSASGLLLFAADREQVDSTGLIGNRALRFFDRGAGEPADRWRGRSGEVFGVSGAAALYRRAMIESISDTGAFFDEAFFAYKEDIDVAWRARLAGWKAVYVAEAVAIHERGWKTAKRGTQPLFIRRHSYINRYRMLVKNAGVRELLRCAPSLLAYEVASFGYLLLRERGVLTSWTSLWRDWGKLRKQRREIRRRRKGAGDFTIMDWLR